MQQSAATAAFCGSRGQAEAVGEHVNDENTTASGEIGHSDTAWANKDRVSVEFHGMNVWESNGRWKTWAPVRLGIILASSAKSHKRLPHMTWSWKQHLDQTALSNAIEFSYCFYRPLVSPQAKYDSYKPPTAFLFALLQCIVTPP